MNFNERLRFLREKNRLTQKELAEILGISKSTYVKYERGEREPKFSILLDLSKHYNVSIDFLLGRSDEEDKNIYSINKTFKLVNDKGFYKDFGKYENSVIKMVSSYTSHLYDLDWRFSLDAFFMSVKIQESLHEIYSDGFLFFNYDEIIKDDEDLKKTFPYPDEEDLKKISKEIKKLHKLVDDYIFLLQSQEFYNPFLIDKDYYFEDEILNYSPKE